jgi:hypothetical protein
VENYCVYVHIAPNGKKYIGITCQKPSKRWSEGYGYRNQNKFYNAIKKYGWDNFQHIILVTNLSREEACAMEQELIFINDTINNGYNQSKGGFGGGFAHTQESKEKLRQAHLGRPHSPEHREKSRKQLELNRLARQRKVYCIETGEIFNSVKEAATAYDLHTGHITECCKDKRKTSGRLHWKYWEICDGKVG